jgi:hypothetical protein
MTSLRDIGYDTASAVADLVDNSIDAGASVVRVDVAAKREWSFIRITDNGRGMTERVLDEAMRYGSRRAYAGDDLGKFGLGLKTASLSQCRRLTVATRTAPAGRIRIRRWDLDHVSKRDAWELEKLTTSECPPYLTVPLRGQAGTTVLWEKLDRVLAYARPDGEYAVRALESLSASISEHLAMVFHRFLAGETRGRRRLTILLNGEKIKPWDPFVRSHGATQKLSQQRFFLVRGGTRHAVRVRPYVLPSQSQFPSAEDHAEAAGPKKWNRQQGFYLYRGDRLIQSGGWNRLRTMDEHSKLARIAIDIPESLEDMFQINVAKMKVALPDEIRPHLRALAAGVVNLAQEAYRRRLRVVEVDEADGGVFDSPEGPEWSLGDHWPVIAEILAAELAEHPELLDRVLLALANARPQRVAAVGAVGT